MSEDGERSTDTAKYKITSQKMKVDVEGHVYLAGPDFQPELVEHRTVENYAQYGHQPYGK